MKVSSSPRLVHDFKKKKEKDFVCLFFSFSFIDSSLISITMVFFFYYKIEHKTYLIFHSIWIQHDLTMLLS